MLSTILVDDEPAAIKTLAWEINTHCPQLEIVAQFTDPVTARHFIRASPPDLLFLDVEMPLLNGFDLLDKIPDVNFDVIFVTAYDEYAVKAFRINAIDYLLKPIITTDLKEAIQRVLIKRQKGESTVELRSRHLRRLKESFNKISLVNNDGIEFVFPHQILYCKSEGSYTYVVMEHKKMLVTRTLGEMEEALQAYTFMRTHRSFLVNLSHIDKYVRFDGGYLIISNGDKVAVSRRKKEELLQLF